MKARKARLRRKKKSLYPATKKTDAMYWRVPGSYGRKG